MNLGQLVTQIGYNEPITRFPSAVHKLETGKGVFYDKQNLYGTDTAMFYVLLINLFDRAIISNNLHHISIEQQKLLTQYFKEANTLTRQHTSAELQDYISPDDEILFDLESEEYITRFNNMDRTIQKLDEFLGSYFGEDNGNYTRYGKKQFYSKRKPFSSQIRFNS